jgi:hypothetical protein
VPKTWVTTSGRTGVKGLQGLLLQIDEAEIVAHEADDPNAFVDFFDSQALAGKDGRDVDAFSVHADSAACGDEDVAIVQGICEFGQAVITARRGRVELGGALHVDGLVWSFLVEFFYELVEAGLLLQAVHAGRPGGLFLEREMHALVTPVLLGISRLDPLDGDAESQPPDREFGEVEQGIRAGEGHAVVGSDSLREAALLEKLLERGDREVFAGRFKRLTQQKVA